MLQNVNVNYLHLQNYCVKLKLMERTAQHDSAHLGD